MSKKSPAPKSPATPRKQLSGAQKRKRAVAREVARALADARTVEYDTVALAAGSSRPSTVEAQELPVYGAPPPKYVAAVEGVLIGLEGGQFHAAAQLADSMLRDDRILATLGVRIQGLIGSPLTLEPAADTNRARRIADDAEAQLSTMLPLHQIGELLRWGLLIGVGVGQVLWQRDAGAWVPRLKVWHPRALRYDWTARAYKLLTADGGEIQIEPGDSSWIVFEPYGPRGWLRCLMRALALPWLIRSWTRSYWARNSEVHGQPLRLGIVPEGAEPGDERRFLSQLSNLAHEAVIRLRQGADGNRFDVKLLEASALSYQGFQALLQHVDDSIAITILGQRQSTMGQGGLGAQEGAGDSVRIDLKRGDALIGHVLRDQILKPWAGYAYGAPDLAPYLCWQVEKPEDLQKKAQELTTVMDALQKARMAQLPVDSRAVLEAFGVPLLDEDDVPPPASAPQDPPEPQGDQDEGDDAEQQTRNLSRLGARADRLTAAARAGDAYSMALAKKAKEMAARALGPDRAAVQAAVEAATSPADLRARLKTAFADMDPERLGDLTHRALILANLAGRAAAHADVKKK